MTKYTELSETTVVLPDDLPPDVRGALRDMRWAERLVEARVRRAAVLAARKRSQTPAIGPPAPKRIEPVPAAALSSSPAATIAESAQPARWKRTLSLVTAGIGLAASVAVLLERLPAFMPGPSQAPALSTAATMVVTPPIEDASASIGMTPLARTEVAAAPALLMPQVSIGPARASLSVPDAFTVQQMPAADVIPVAFRPTVEVGRLVKPTDPLPRITKENTSLIPGQPQRPQTEWAAVVGEGPKAGLAPEIAAVVPDAMVSRVSAPALVTLAAVNPPLVPDTPTRDATLRLFVPNTDPARDAADVVMAGLDAAGFDIDASGNVGFVISQTHLRYYDPAMAETANEIAAALGVEARRMSGEAADGLVEVWIAGRGWSPRATAAPNSGLAALDALRRDLSRAFRRPAVTGRAITQRRGLQLFAPSNDRGSARDRSSAEFPDRARPKTVTSRDTTSGGEASGGGTSGGEVSGSGASAPSEPTSPKSSDKKSDKKGGKKDKSSDRKSRDRGGKRDK